MLEPNLNSRTWYEPKRMLAVCVLSTGGDGKLDAHYVWSNEHPLPPHSDYPAASNVTKKLFMHSPIEEGLRKKSRCDYPNNVVCFWILCTKWTVQFEHRQVGFFVCSQPLLKMLSMLRYVWQHCRQARSTGWLLVPHLMQWSK